MQGLECASSFEYDTVLPADSVEFCPQEDSSQFVACGTYLLNEGEKKREGRLLVFTFDHSTGLYVKQTIPCPGILDIKWSPRRVCDTLLIAQAEAEGGLRVLSLSPTEGTLSLLSFASFAPDSISLSLGWNNGMIHSDTPSIVVSHDNCKLSVWTLSNRALSLSRSWTAHQHEVWIAAFNPHEPTTIFSGSDDCSLKGWDLRTDLSSPTFTNRKCTMGVTTIQFSPHNPHSVAVGSYDEQVRIFDTRKMVNPLLSVSVGGGVWRVKHHPQSPSLLLTANMHNGHSVLEIRPSEIVPRYAYKRHKSLAYGADWSHAEDGRLVGSCSFYDHLFTLWRVPSL